jgi:uncharacterized protein YqgC (DUF456 family)
MTALGQEEYKMSKREDIPATVGLLILSFALGAFTVIIAPYVQFLFNEIVRWIG